MFFTGWFRMQFIKAIELAIFFRMSKNMTFFVLGHMFLIVPAIFILLFLLKVSYMPNPVVVSTSSLTFLTISIFLLVTFLTLAYFYCPVFSPFIIVYLLFIVACFFIILEGFYYFFIIAPFLLIAILSTLALTSLFSKSS
jgi:hypothetical protein